MTSGSERGRSRFRPGCLVAAALVLTAILAGAGVVGVAFRQMRAQRPEVRASAPDLPGAAAANTGEEPVALPSHGRVEFDVAVGRLTVTPAPEGAQLRVEANYDSTFYRLEQKTETTPSGAWTYRVRFEPVGSRAMALLRMKLGGEPPSVRIELPRGVPLVLSGRAEGSLVALELGGLRVTGTEVRTSGGASMVSFARPLAAPMDRLELTGDKGSVKVTWLGNASPRSTVIHQRLGALDLDLRGAWARDGDVRLDATMAGGSVWLPADLAVEGVPGVTAPPLASPPEEIPKLRLRLTVSERSGRLVFIR